MKLDLALLTRIHRHSAEEECKDFESFAPTSPRPQIVLWINEEEDNREDVAKRKDRMDPQSIWERTQKEEEEVNFLR
jgi:hypothetical protein